MTELFFEQQILNKKYLFSFAKKAIVQQIQTNTKLKKAITIFQPVVFFDDGVEIQIYKKNRNREIVGLTDKGNKKRVVTDIVLCAKVEYGELMGEMEVCDFISAFCVAVDTIKPPLICRLPRGLHVANVKKREKEENE